MKLHSETRLENIRFDLDPTTTQIAVTDFHWNSHVAFSDKDKKAITGPETLVLPKCESREEFISKLNESEFIHVSVHDDFFSVQDCSNIFAEAPEGLYKSSAVDKRVSVVKEVNASFTLKQFVDTKSFTSAARNIYIRGGLQSIANSFVSFSGTTSHTKLLQANSLLLGTDLVQDVNKVPLEVSRTSGITLVRAKLKESIVELENNGRVIMPALLLDDSVLLSLVGKNNGLFMQSPCISWINDYNQGNNADSLDVSESGFILRAGIVFRKKHITETSTFPVDTKELLIQRIAGNIYEIHAVKKDDTKVLCLRTVALGTNTRLCISDNKQSARKFLLPIIRKTTATASRDGFLAAALRSPASNDYTICTSPKIEATVVGAALKINTIGTGITITQGVNYLLIIEKDADLEVSLINLDANTTQTFADSGSSFSYSVTVNGVITWKAGIVLGPWCYGTTLTELDKAVQIVRAECEGQPSSVDLGAYDSTAKTFANYTASYNHKAEALTVSGINYFRQPLKFSHQVANILRTDRTFEGSVDCNMKSYSDRIQKAHVYADGLDIVGYNNTSLVALVDLKKGVDTPVFHRCSGKKVDFHYVLIDGQTNEERRFEKPDQTSWSLTVSTS